MITPGLILIAEGTVLPDSITLETESHPPGWTSAQSSDQGQLKKQLGTAEWIFYYLAGAIKMSAFGTDRKRTVQRALGRILAQVKLQKCNCVEIDDVATRSFLGLPYVTISAHSRHIEKAPPVF
ncbi:MAG: hypothetical protein ACXWSR_22455 [Bdellovibrionota bacterium]